MVGSRLPVALDGRNRRSGWAGQFVAHVDALVDRLVGDGVLDEAEGERVISAAARSRVGRPPR